MALNQPQEQIDHANEFCERGSAIPVSRPLRDLGRWRGRRACCSVGYSDGYDPLSNHD
jgi:hypothetical protein